MIWFVLAISAAFFEALTNVFGKKSLKNSDEYIVAWSLAVFSTIFLIPFVVIDKIPSLGGQFWLPLALGGILDTIASLIYIKAIKESDLSITLPMIALTPVFTLITSPVMVGEWPNWLDLIGVLLIGTGAYLLNIKEKSRGYLGPFRALLQEKGPKWMLCVAVIESITSNFDKIGVENSSPLFWAIATFTANALLLLPMVLYKSRNPGRKILKGWRILVPMGIFSILTVVCQMQAVNLTEVVQVTAINRTSVLMDVLFGHFIFHEQGLKERLFGAVTMILGVSVMTLF